jgi:hypothetical protein
MLHVKFRGMLLVLLTITLFLSSCSKDKNNPVEPGNGNDGPLNAQVKVKLNGAGFDNQEITLTRGYSSYLTTDNETYAAFWGKTGNDSVYVAFQFSGSRSGTFNWRAENYDAAVIMMNDDNALLYLATSDGKTSVITYAAVGQKIEGTISGKLVEVSTMDEIIVSGTFSIVRGSDSD